MKVLAGGKPWRRKPSDAPGGERGEHAGGGAVEREGDHRQGDGGDHADAGREAVDPVDQVDHVDHRDDAEHRADVAEVDRRPPGRVSRSTVPGSRRPKNGKVKFSTVTPAETGIDHRRDLAERASAPGRGRRRRRATPTRAITTAPTGSPGSRRPRAARSGRRPGPREDRQAAELRRRRVVQGALVGLVDRPDAAAPAGSSGHQEQRQRRRRRRAGRR